MKTKAHFTLNRLMRLSLLSFLSAGILSANPVGDYRFQDSLENSLGPESPLANIGSGNEFANENVLGRHRRVLKFPAGGGVLLDNLSDLLASSGTYTVAILFRLDTVSSYRKILDFKNRSLDSGFYCRSGNANFYAPYHEGDGSPITAGDFVTVVLARDAADNVVRAYVNGEEQFSFIDSDFRAVVDGNDRWIFFQDDTPTGGSEASSGAVARILIFDRALSAQDIEELDLSVTGGDGSIENPYFVTTIEDFLRVGSGESTEDSEGAWDMDKHYRQMADIDFGGMSLAPVGHQSGDGFISFQGTYDGNHYSLINFNMTFPNDRHIGFFASLDSGEVRNVNIKWATIIGGVSVGGIVGRAPSGHIVNCRVMKSHIEAKGAVVGGIMGSGDSAYASHDTFIENCASRKNVIIGTHYTGGIAGAAARTTIRNCFSTSSVAATAIHSHPNMGAGSFCGGIAGHNAWNGQIYNSYSAGPLSAADGNPAGISGFYRWYGALVSGSYWDTETTGTAYTHGSGEGRTTAQMMRQSTFSGWDFSDIWQMDEDESFPYFQSPLVAPRPSPAPPFTFALGGAFTVAEGNMYAGAVTATGGDGSPPTFSMLTGPERGDLTLNADGSFNYQAHRQPTLGFVGTDSFTFVANDGQEDSNVATVSITITPVNSAPVAQDADFTVAVDETLSDAVTATDEDGDALQFALRNAPQHGEISFAANGEFTYTPNTGFSGVDSFTFIANDLLVDSNTATVTITVLPQTPQRVLTFEGLADNEPVKNFYNGGLGGSGSGPGPDYGVYFSGNGLALTTGNYSNPPSEPTILFFLTGDATTMNVPAGFHTGFSFFYASSEAVQIRVYDGLDATGNELATLDLPATPNWYNNWVPTGVSFDGIARSVDFAGAANLCGFDNITLGSEAPGDLELAAPEQLSPVDITPTGMVARWRPVPGAVRYRIDVGLDEDFNQYLDGHEKLDVAQTTHYQLSALEPGSWYAIRIFAEDASGLSLPSNTVWVPTGDNIPYPKRFPPDGPVSLGALLHFHLPHRFHGAGMAYDTESSDEQVVAASVDAEGNLRLEMLSPGEAQIVITATDLATGYTATHRLTIEVVDDQPAVESNTFAEREPWNMRFTQTVEIRNTSGRNALGVRVLFSNLADGMTVENQTGLNEEGRPILDVETFFPDGDLLSFNIVYLSTMVSPEDAPPLLEFEYILRDPPQPLPEGGVMITRQILLDDGTGRVVMEFESTPGALYAVEYMNNFPNGTWIQVPLRLRAGANRTQWIDPGPPATRPMEGVRVYRVKQIFEGEK